MQVKICCCNKGLVTTAGRALVEQLHELHVKELEEELLVQWLSCRLGRQSCWYIRCR